jgi:type VII secretion protein EccE
MPSQTAPGAGRDRARQKPSRGAKSEHAGKAAKQAKQSKGGKQAKGSGREAAPAGPGTGSPDTGSLPRQHGSGAPDPGPIAPVHPRRASRPGRFGPFRVQQLILVEAAVGAGLAGLAWRTSFPLVLPVLGVIAVLLVIVALMRIRGHAPGDFLRARSALRIRQSRADEARVEPGTDPAVMPVLECEPALRVAAHTVESRGPGGAGSAARTEHREIGMVGDGTFLSAVLQIDPRDEPLRPSRSSRPLPLPVLRSALRVDDIVLSSVQVVQFTQPAPAPHLPEQALAARAYRDVPEGPSTAGLRLTWVALRLDPELCRRAVEARGGGEEGARRALQRAADQLSARLTEAGFRVTVLDEQGVNSALATAICPSPLATAQSRGQTGTIPQVGRRTAETRRAWRCDDRWHTTYWLSRWPSLSMPGGPGKVSAPAMVNLLTSGSALASTFSLEVREVPVGEPDSAAISGYVRLTARSESELSQLSKQLEGRAHSAGAGLSRLDLEQVPGVLATLPLGGTR